MKSRKTIPIVTGKETPPAKAQEIPVHGLIAAALEISAKRAQTLRCMKSALERGDDFKALQMARELCGLENEQQSRRRIN
jgi:hypothetical protein